MLHNHLLVATIIFVMTYTAIISEKINRTAVALFGAVLIVVFQVLPQEDAFKTIDFNTIGLLIGMMIVVNILKRTGVFQYIAIKTAKIAKGDPLKIMIYFSAITALSSAFLPNVTIILLIVPVTFVITDTLKINPIPFLITEVLAANIGGTATLIGDPPNTMIGGATKLGFMDFLINLGPIVLVILVVTLIILKIVYRKYLRVDDNNKQKILDLDETKTIKDKKLLIKSLIVLGITILGFTTHQIIGLESATVALFGGVLLLLVSKVEPEEILLEIEWTNILFFIGLFVLVGALEEVGAIEFLAKKMIQFTNGNLFMTVMFVLWLSALASSFLDNIPFVATMIPLIKDLAVISTMNIQPLWWALALGACLGGNGTLIGASPNVIVGSMLNKKGYKLTFTDFMKIGFPIMIVSIIISMVYLIVFYI
ncbi:possible tyrosine transporter P-protein (TC 2.A.45.2.1) [Caminicella sporogenes DSM 14501]|uniref:Possible tyrosine transporter P-protein (TC 2.A.45.2.1) n=1 Tax=Caminicella sporogenes DSM 14501 TaxID=1121266 RepID=A0A1M6S3I1_9FIRM|nr:ArsB/NhaD family transporter [Caminicella sporogenes]RKD27184.1 hypothetical protein BET04_09725 [Caminicella sporogenes]SHK39285.1 possible tyrosine transporter P-protein (TC 2.A.45.2.1) [Caminicella sporogenes DSM 14501]